MDVTEQHEAESGSADLRIEQIRPRGNRASADDRRRRSYIYVLRPDGTALYANQTVLDYTRLTCEDVQSEDQRARVFTTEDVERLRDERHEALAQRYSL